MTPDQRAALDKLTPKRRAFVLAYAENGGNALAAATEAGYGSPHPEGARLLRNATVLFAVRALTEPAENAKVLNAQQIRELWTAIALGDEPDVCRDPITGEQDQCTPAMRDRLKALDSLAKSGGMYIERREVVVSTPTTREEAEGRLDALRLKIGRGS